MSALPYINELDSLNGAWKAATPIENLPLEDGKHQAQVTGCTFKKTNPQNTGKLPALVIEVEYTVVSGPCQGRKAWRTYYLEDEKGLAFFKGDVAKLDPDMANHLQLANVVQYFVMTMQNRYVLIEQKTNVDKNGKVDDAGNPKTYRNIYLVEVYAMNQEAPPAEAPLTEGDIPF